MTELRIGFWFLLGPVHYTVVHFCETSRGNVALLVRMDAECPYITVRDLSKRTGGNYDWAWGHYFKNFEDAVRDYLARKADLEG